MRLLWTLLLGSALAAPVARADTAVFGARAGTQHSPSVAMSERRTYVLAADRVDNTNPVDLLRLAGSGDGALTFQPVALPVLPPNWYWRPDGYIAWDYFTNQVWMVGQARTVGAPTTQIGVYVAAGFPLPDGSILWGVPVALWTHFGGVIILPALALATGDGSGSGFVLFADGFESTAGPARLFRVTEDVGSFTSQDLAVGGVMDSQFTTPALAVGPNGDVFAAWVRIAAGQTSGPYTLLGRTSHDSGQTFGPSEFIGALDFIANGPGAVLDAVQLPTLLFATHSTDFPDTRLAFWATPYSGYAVPDPSEVFLVNDCCGGAWNTFGSTLPRSPGSWELNPTVTQAEDGYFYMGWHDFQPYDPDSISRFTVTRLWNMGFSAAPPVPFASASFDWDNVVSNLAGMGWTSGVANFQDRVTFAWGDHRGTSPDVYARSFRAGGYALSGCAGDTVGVVAGQHATLSWRIENHNELFGDDYSYGASGTRPWTNGLDPGTVVIAPDGHADVTFGIDVPDTAAGGLVPVFAYANDHVRHIDCPMFLRINPLVAAGPGPVGGALALSAPRPNPSAGATTIAFTLPARSDVDLAVYDVRGRREASLVRGTFDPGEQVVRWDGAGESGARVAPGIHFVRMTVRAAGAVTTRERRLIFLR